MKNNDENKKVVNKRKLKSALYFAAIISLYVIVEYWRLKHGGSDTNEQLNQPTQGTEYNGPEENDISEMLSNLEVQFIDVGQADCILIRTNDECMLIDAGNNADGKKLVKYFKDLGISKFEYVVGTHAHEDHIGGMDDIIDNFEIENFYMPDVITTTKTFEDVLDSLATKNYYLDTPNIGDKFNLGEGEFRVVYVGHDSKDYNETSIVLRLDFGEMSYLFTGDIAANVEELILNDDIDIDIDILKVAHHGSKYGSSDAFLKATTPEYGFIEVGKGNKYDHPTEETLQRLEDNNVIIYRTDLDGTIITETDGKKLTLRKEKTDTDGNK